MALSVGVAQLGAMGANKQATCKRACMCLRELLGARVSFAQCLLLKSQRG